METECILPSASIVVINTCDISGSEDPSEPLGDVTSNGQSYPSRKRKADDQGQPSLSFHSTQDQRSDDVVTYSQGEPLGGVPLTGQPDSSRNITMDDQRPQCLTNAIQDPLDPSDDVTTSNQSQPDEGEAIEDMSEPPCDAVRAGDLSEPSHDLEAMDHDDEASSGAVSSSDILGPHHGATSDPLGSSHGATSDQQGPCHGATSDPHGPYHESTSDPLGSHHGATSGQNGPPQGACDRDTMLACFWQDYELGDWDSVLSVLENEALLDKEDRVLRQEVLYRQSY